MTDSHDADNRIIYSQDKSTGRIVLADHNGRVISIDDEMITVHNHPAIFFYGDLLQTSIDDNPHPELHIIAQFPFPQNLHHALIDRICERVYGTRVTPQSVVYVYDNREHNTPGFGYAISQNQDSWGYFYKNSTRHLWHLFAPQGQSVLLCKDDILLVNQDDIDELTRSETARLAINHAITSNLRGFEPSYVSTYTKAYDAKMVDTEAIRTGVIKALFGDFTNEHHSGVTSRYYVEERIK